MLRVWAFWIKINRQAKMDEYIDVKIDIFEHTGQRARVRRTLTTGGLIDEIMKEFDDISRASIDRYALYLKGTDRPLSKGSTIIDLDLQPQDELVFEYKHQNFREDFLPRQYASLRDDKSGRMFEIQWQPAVIGRPTAEAEHNMVLAVNVQDIPNGMTISRKHAQIILEDESYYVETLTENNPVLVNGEVVPFNSRKEIKNNDRLILGNQKVSMTFITRKQSTNSAARDAQSQPIPPVVKQATEPKPEPSPAAPAAVQPPSEPMPGKPSPGGATPNENMIGETFAGFESPPCRFIVEKAETNEVNGQRIEITSYPFILGRVLPLFSTENGVSRRHAEVNFDSQRKLFTIIDLMSTNGVTLDGVEIMGSVPYELKAGMHVGLGPDVMLKFEG
jgi:pSer/pThr/pTyr-binding forkhead associated (FHA) protein